MHPNMVLDFGLETLGSDFGPTFMLGLESLWTVCANQRDVCHRFASDREYFLGKSSTGNISWGNLPCLKRETCKPTAKFGQTIQTS